jgi:hypothetical protein
MGVLFTDKHMAKCCVCKWEGKAGNVDQEEHPFKYPSIAGVKEWILICPECESCIEPDSDFVWCET